MNDLILITLAVIVLAGTCAAAISKDPFDKLIALAMVFAGAVPFIIEKGYLDLVIAAALIVPVTTIITLQAVWRCGE